MGNGAKVLIQKALEAAGVPEEDFFPETFRTFQRIFDNNCTYRVKPYEGIVSLLTELKMRGMKLGVLSNKPDRQAVHVVSEIFGEDLFDIVWGQKEGVPRENRILPHFCLWPGTWAQILQRLFTVGDSEVDIRTGQARRCKNRSCVLGVPAAGRSEKSRSRTDRRFHAGDF